MLSSANGSPFFHEDADPLSSLATCTNIETLKTMLPDIDYIDEAPPIREKAALHDG